MISVPQIVQSEDICVHRFTNSFYTSNTYILNIINNASTDAWLVDCGDSEPIVQFLDENGLTLRGIFITHGHYDHIYGLNDICERYGDIAIYTNENGRQNLYDTRYNFSKFHELDFIYKGTNVNLIDNESKIKLFEHHSLSVIATPGHDWSCLSYQLGNFLFTGDSYIPNVKTVTIFPKSNKIQAQKSEELIHTLIQSSTIICPGHGMMQLQNNNE